MFNYTNSVGAYSIALRIGSALGKNVAFDLTIWKSGCHSSWDSINGKYFSASVFQNVFGVSIHSCHV